MDKIKARDAGGAEARHAAKPGAAAAGSNPGARQPGRGVGGGGGQ